MKDRIEIFTDGGCRKKDIHHSTGPGSYAFVIICDGIKLHEKGDYFPNVTNNQMELTAAIEALNYIVEEGMEKNEIIVYSDSQYLVKGMEEWMKGWVRKNWIGVKNDIYWKVLRNLKMKINDLTFSWVRGHAENEWNNYVDELCTSTVTKNLI